MKIKCCIYVESFVPFFRQHKQTKVKHMKANKQESKSKQDITYPVACLITFTALIIYTVIAFIIEANI